MNRKTVSVIIAISFLLNTINAFAQTNRGAGNVKVKKEDGKTEEIKLYEGSYALVVGVSDYTNGWKDLKGVKTDVAAVKEVLESQGFTVRTVLDPTGEQLQAALNSFVRDYGYTFGNRLLFYYAGHGDTQPSADGRKLGYIVPSDAPLPTKDLAGFNQTAISMNDFEYYAQRIQAKHALFVFDSCFSGTMLTTTRSNVPPVINFKTTQPVRQFITAGSDDQEVPDVSEFRKQFVEGLNGEADSNRDGYITGSELSDFLQTKVSNYTREAQTPQYGKIRDGRLDKGDFVFIVKPNTATVEPVKPGATITARDRSAIEREAWSYINNSANAQDFRDFLKDFPDGANAANAKIKLEQAVWDAVKDSRDKTKIQAYLNEFQTGANAPLARIKLRQADAPTTTSIPVNSNTTASVKAGAVRKNTIGMELVYIPAGEFMMGSSEAEVDEAFYEAKKAYAESKRDWFTPEMPKHKVTIKEGFWMGKTEVTQGQWKAIMGDNPSKFSDCGDNCPVEQVSWDDVQVYLKRINENNDGFVYSLPSEAEWEYAARAGTTTAFSFGNSLNSSQANFNGDSPYASTKGTTIGKTVRVGSYQPNNFGLYDMHGNVYEWVQDIYNPSYQNLPTDGSANTSVGNSSSRVLRGGGWTDSAYGLRSAVRVRLAPAARIFNFGFRVAARLR